MSVFHAGGEPDGTERERLLVPPPALLTQFLLHRRPPPPPWHRRLAKWLNLRAWFHRLLASGR